MVNWTAVRGPAGRMKQAMGYVLMIIDTLIQYAKTSKKILRRGDRATAPKPRRDPKPRRF